MGERAAPHILIADDDPVIVRLLQVNFRLEGYEVETATHGEEAIQKAHDLQPELILLDVMMPGVDGWEVCRRLMDDPATAGIPIVFLSARAQDEDRKRGLALGVAEYVTKPFDPGELVALVARLIGKRDDETAERTRQA